MLCAAGSWFAGSLSGRAVPEAFVDRAYGPTGALLPRSEPGAVVHDSDVVVARAVRLAQTGEVVAVDGSVLHLAPRSLCLHGDTPGAVGLGRQVAGWVRQRSGPAIRWRLAAPSGGSTGWSSRRGW